MKVGTSAPPGTERTYNTLDNELLDLTGLSAAESEFFEHAYRAWCQGMEWEKFVNTVQACNPLLEPGRRVTRYAYYHPLYRAIQDLADRLGISQGELSPDNENDAAEDPVSDVWVSVAEAAEDRQVTNQALRLAVDRGEVIATNSRPQMVSRRSLDRWRPSETRQRAGRVRMATA